MVLDSSAILAILFNEPESPAIRAAISRDPVRLLSAASLVESSIVIEARYGRDGGRELDLLIYRGEIQVVPVDRDQAELAREAFRRFGKGSHPAALSLGDCFSYALSRVSGEALCFKGTVFTKTDLELIHL